MSSRGLRHNLLIAQPNSRTQYLGNQGISVAPDTYLVCLIPPGNFRYRSAPTSFASKHIKLLRH